MGPVPHQRPAQGHPNITAAEFGVLELESAHGAQRVGAVEAEDRAAGLVAAGVGDDGDHAAGRAADLGVEALARDPELAHRVLAESLPGETGDRIGELDSVDQDRRLRPGSGGADDRCSCPIEVLDPVGLHPRSDEGEPLELAVDHRQLPNLLRNHVGRGIAPLHVHQRRLAADLEGLLHLRPDKSTGARPFCADPQHAVRLGGRLEAGERGRDLVGPGRQALQQPP